ncbi:MAG TPA: DUF983 domain-containing protein [Stellaceae bacterium]|nr:DUF983 domain-containing protein [Stellaceae bacterium]
MTGEAPAVSVLAAALTCRCPRCGKGKVLQGLLTVAPSCTVCGLDLHAEDVGDGPAAFVILILGILIVAAALLVEVKAAPPFWVHIILWPPIALAGTILLQRSLKAWMIAMQYRHHLLDGGQPR